MTDDTKADALLVQAARSGDEAAAGELFRRHWTASWRIASAITQNAALADEAAQDGWDRAFRSLARYDAGRPFFPWLARIVARRALTTVEQEARRRRRVAVLHGRAEPADDGEQSERLRAAVSALTPERRAVVALHYWLGYSLGETADYLEIAPGTAASRLSRALADLRSMLHEGDGS